MTSCYIAFETQCPHSQQREFDLVYIFIKYCLFTFSHPKCLVTTLAVSTCTWMTAGDARTCARGPKLSQGAGRQWVHQCGQRLIFEHSCSTKRKNVHSERCTGGSQKTAFGGRVSEASELYCCTWSIENIWFTTWGRTHGQNALNFCLTVLWKRKLCKN